MLNYPPPPAGQTIPITFDDNWLSVQPTAVPTHDSPFRRIATQIKISLGDRGASSRFIVSNPYQFYIRFPIPPSPLLPKSLYCFCAFCARVTPMILHSVNVHLHPSDNEWNGESKRAKVGHCFGNRVGEGIGRRMVGMCWTGHQNWSDYCCALPGENGGRTPLNNGLKSKQWLADGRPKTLLMASWRLPKRVSRKHSRELIVAFPAPCQQSNPIILFSKQSIPFNCFDSSGWARKGKRPTARTANPFCFPPLAIPICPSLLRLPLSPHRHQKGKPTAASVTHSLPCPSHSASRQLFVCPFIRPRVGYCKRGENWGEMQSAENGSFRLPGMQQAPQPVHSAPLSEPSALQIPPAGSAGDQLPSASSGLYPYQANNNFLPISAEAFLATGQFPLYPQIAPTEQHKLNNNNNIVTASNGQQQSTDQLAVHRQSSKVKDEQNGADEKGKKDAEKAPTVDKQQHSHQMAAHNGENKQSVGVQQQSVAPPGQFPYDSSASVAASFGTFGAMPPPEYGDWIGQGQSGYPIPSAPHQMLPPPPCPLPLAPEEFNAMYGANLMSIPNGLHYELEPAMNGYGAWSGGYYLGPEQTKLLADSAAAQSYLSGSDRYGSGATAPPFYNPLQQGISPSAGLDPAAFQTTSALPPPPSQLSTVDQLYGQPNAFGPSLLAPSAESAIAQSLLSPPNGGGNALLQLDPSAQFYAAHPDMFGAQPAETAIAPGLGKRHTSGNSANVISAIRQNASKRSGRTAGQSLKGAGGPMGRPSTSQGMLAERAHPTSPQEKPVARKSRSRSVVKDSSDDEKSTEEKEAERRNANNTRERIRVRDINSAFKELARLCCQHMPNVDERGLTKLNTLLKAVELIPLLEKKVEEKNQMMSARKDCIKHRLDGGPMAPLANHQFPMAAGPSSLVGNPIPMFQGIESRNGQP